MQAIAVLPVYLSFCLCLLRQLRPLCGKLQPALFERIHGDPSHLVAGLGLRAEVLRQNGEGGSVGQAQSHSFSTHGGTLPDKMGRNDQFALSQGRDGDSQMS